MDAPGPVSLDSQPGLEPETRTQAGLAAPGRGPQAAVLRGFRNSVTVTLWIPEPSRRGSQRQLAP